MTNLVGVVIKVGIILMKNLVSCTFQYIIKLKIQSTIIFVYAIVCMLLYLSPLILSLSGIYDEDPEIITLGYSDFGESM